jgi:hypothetical protein
MDDGAIVLGAVELTANAVKLSVNSEARAARGRTLLEPVLAGPVRAPLIERQTVYRRATSRVRRTPFVFHPTKSAASFTKASRIITAGPWTSRSRV